MEGGFSRSLLCHLTSLLLLLQLPTKGSTDEFQVIGPTDPIVAVLGRDTTLHCSLSPAMSAENMELQWYRSKFSEAVFIYQNQQEQKLKQMPQYAGRTSLVKDFLTWGEAAVRIDMVQISDDGLYTCFFKKGSFYEEATLEVKVAGVGSAPEVRIEGPEEDGVRVACTASGWFPKPQVQWRDLSGEKFLAFSEAHAQDSDGLYSVEASLVVRDSSAGKVTCSILNPILGQEKAKAIFIPEPFFPQASPWKPAFAMSLIILCLLILGAGYFLKKEHSAKVQALQKQETLQQAQEEDRQKTEEAQKARGKAGEGRGWVRAELVLRGKADSRSRALGCSLQEDPGPLPRAGGSGDAERAAWLWRLGWVWRENFLHHIEGLFVGFPGTPSFPFLRDGNSCLFYFILFSLFQMNSRQSWVSSSLPPELSVSRLGGIIALSSPHFLCVAFQTGGRLFTRLDRREDGSQSFHTESGCSLTRVCSLSAWRKAQLYADWRKEQFQTWSVTLDPCSAHPNLSLSQENMHLTWKYPRMKPKNVKCSVLGLEGITSGRSYWEVEARGSDISVWAVGVCREDVVRKGWFTECPEKGFWVVEWFFGECVACTTPQTQLFLRKYPFRVGIFLDYDAGDISFYNMTDNSHIFSFSEAFSPGKLFPYFMLNSRYTSLTICSIVDGSKGPPVPLNKSASSLNEPLSPSGEGLSSGSGGDGVLPRPESPLLPRNSKAVPR
ncbi:butyrophilin subfamily 1 member A1-like [Trichechus manatus latirostris]|uniref:Butyrophilin subfamily 1 member A1-like n=1 Tax=Trichechus manatus latirostris TaxID=127582 RepID=A0A2Y9QJA4_TRIMA|nr:butyrophilin subfamily 1 member A1-like [Trichechus manatus latirostris]